MAVMTTTLTSPTHATSSAPDCAQRLRDLQRVNAAVSGLTGISMAAFSGWLSDQIDLPRALTLGLGLGLVAWSALLLAVARQPTPRLVRAALVVAAGDAAWVVGSVALVVWRNPSGLGIALVLAAAAVVDCFAVIGFVVARRVRGQDSHR